MARAPPRPRQPPSRLPSADSAARPELLSCLPKKVTKEGHPKVAREPCFGHHAPAAPNSLRLRLRSDMRRLVSGARHPPQGAPHGTGRSRQEVCRHSCPNFYPWHLIARGARIAGAARNGRRPSVPKRPERPVHIHKHCRRNGDCLDLRLPFAAPSGEGFRGKQGADCLSVASAKRVSAPPAKTLGAREAPGRAAGRGRGIRACFLVTSLHEQRSPFLINNGRGALASQRTAGRGGEGTVNTGGGARASRARQAACRSHVNAGC